MKDLNLTIKKVLNEVKQENNFIQKKLLIKEEDQKCGPPPNGQTFPLTMNQIYQFQNYIWTVIEKDLPKISGSCNKEGKDCSYNSMLCSVKPCKRKKAVDGFYGDNAKTAWSKFGATYKQKKPCWWVDDSETQRQLTGQEIPVSMIQTKAFQRWIWIDVYKFPDDRTSKQAAFICPNSPTPCTYNQAVDGIFAGNTKKTWENKEIRDSYIKANPKWYLDIAFDVRSQKEQEKQIWIVKNFKVREDNPSGYDGYSPVSNIMKWIKTNAQVLFKPTEEEATAIVLPNYGWDVNPTLFPKPIKYSEADIKNLQTEEEIEEVKKLDVQLNDVVNPVVEPHMISDYLGKGGKFETQQIAISGVDTKKDKIEYLTKKKENLMNPFALAAQKWNKKMDVVKSQITNKCSRPMKFWFNGLNDSKGQEFYISYYSVCKYAGGLWTYNKGNEVVCGCRYMSDKNGLVAVNESGYAGFEYDDDTGTIVVKGSDGQFKAIDMKSLDFEMDFQTKGGAQDQIYGDGKLDIHDVLTVVEIGTLIAGMIATGPASIIFIGVSAIVGLSDAVLYFKEGDPYMGTMMTALNLLGVDEIMALAKWGKNLISKFSKEALEKIGKKQLAKQALDKSEKLLLTEMQQFVYRNQFELAANMQYKMTENFITKGFYDGAVKNNWGWDILFNSVVQIGKKIGNGKFGMVLKIGGVMIGTDQLYLILFGNDSDRENSSIAMLLDKMYAGLGFTREQKINQLKKAEEAKLAFNQIQTDMKNNPGSFMNSNVQQVLFNFDPTKVNMQEVNTRLRMLNESRGQKPTPEKVVETQKMKYIQAPEITDVIEGKTISFGMSGDSVVEINKLLISLGKTDITKLELYDSLTEFYVSEMQKEYKLSETGIVDYETLIVLKGWSSSQLCDKLEEMKKNGWTEINSIKKNALKSVGKQNKILEFKCGTKDIVIYNETYNPDSTGSELFKTEAEKNSGTPVHKTMMDNPGEQELNEEIKKIKDMINFI